MITNTPFRNKVPSETVLRLTGTYIEDDTAPKSPLTLWLQSECRNGHFQKIIEDSVSKQIEPLRADLVLVEKIDPEGIMLRVPGRLTDHESPSALEVEATFHLNPLTLEIKRIT